MACASGGDRAEVIKRAESYTRPIDNSSENSHRPPRLHVGASIQAPDGIKMEDSLTPKERDMSLRTLVLVVLWAVSLIAAAAIAIAQAPETVLPIDPIIVSGNEVGFRIEGQRGQTPVGTIVVRIEGQWVEATLSQVRKPRIAVPLTERPATPVLPGIRRP
jgi:hypothetical protein